MATTNFEKWKLYCDSLPSPDSYIRWSWYYLITAALQRRVWMPPNHDRVYPNIYVTLVGKPGVGKGGPIRAVASLLKQWNLEDAVRKKENNSEAENAVIDEIAKKELEDAQEQMKSIDKKYIGKPLLIPVAADAITYEALVQQMAQSIRYINYRAVDDKTGKESMKVYGHSSLAFCLEEQASLFKHNKETKTTINFLIQAYDCGETYEYITKTSGKDRIIRVCLNFLAGTTPGFMQETFDQGILTEGFSSRTFYIYSAKNRKPVFSRPELTEEQKIARDEIAAHIKKLTALYGQIQVDQETLDLMQAWIEEDFHHPQNRASKSPKLDAYYARKNLHIMKIAMAIHFGENTDMHISKDAFKEAISVLHEEEKTMHLALLVGGNNPTSKLANKIERFVENNGATAFKQLYAEFYEDGKKEEIEEALNFLVSTERMKQESIECPLTKKIIINYKRV